MLKRYAPLLVVLLGGCIRIDTPSHECSGLCIVRDIYAVTDTTDAEIPLIDADTTDAEITLMDADTTDAEITLMDADTYLINLIDYGTDAEWDCIHRPDASCQVPDILFELPSDANCIERPTFDIEAWDSCLTAHPILSNQERRIVSLGRGDASLFMIMLSGSQSWDYVFISGLPGNSREPPILEGDCVGSSVGAVLIDTYDGRVKFSYWLVDGEEPPMTRTIIGLHQYDLPYYLLLVRDNSGVANCELNLNINIR